MHEHIYPLLPPKIADVLKNISDNQIEYLTELRLRANKPLLLVLGSEDFMISLTGRLVTDRREACLCTQDDIVRTFQLICRNSIYALEQELKLGFLTVKGGHRIGLAGQAVTREGQLKAIKNISSLNIRLAREIKGCGDLILPYIIQDKKRVLSTLIISPPRCGKTTILRDLIRSLSTRSDKFIGVQVGVVDERSEIAACLSGVPTVELGERIDVLDGCPKSEGMLILIRSMSPHVIATDELGRQEDAFAVREALNAGISVIATVHGRDANEVLNRPYIGDLIEKRFFERYVILTDNPTVGTVKEIIETQTGKTLYFNNHGVKICG